MKAHSSAFFRLLGLLTVGSFKGLGFVTAITLFLKANNKIDHA